MPHRVRKLLFLASSQRASLQLMVGEMDDDSGNMPFLACSLDEERISKDALAHGGVLALDCVIDVDANLVVSVTICPHLQGQDTCLFEGTTPSLWSIPESAVAALLEGNHGIPINPPAPERTMNHQALLSLYWMVGAIRAESPPGMAAEEWALMEVEMAKTKDAIDKGVDGAPTWRGHFEALEMAFDRLAVALHRAG